LVLEKEKNVIEYIASNYPIEFDQANPNANLEDVAKLMNILAETQQIAYFKTGYIQRLIDY
jgi:hypothetical protein